MLRKFTDFLFKEEEVIIEEEDISVKKERVEPILKVEPIKPVFKEVEPKPVIEQEQADNKPKKRIMIDLDERPLRQPSSPTINRVVEKTPYSPKEIISPIFGGSTLPEPIDNKPVGKSRQPLTKVISPIYGAVVEDDTTESEIDVYELSLQDLIQPEVKDNEDIQVSLFDVLQENESDE